MMHRIKNIAKGLFFVGFTLSFFTIPKAYAVSYDCRQDVTEAGLSDCCFSDEPLEGIACRPEGQYLQKLGSNVPVCKDPAVLAARAREASPLNLYGFNCFDNTLTFGRCKNDDPSLCYDGSQSKCAARADTSYCDNLFRGTTCGKTCGGCKAGYTECNGKCIAGGTESNTCIGWGRYTVCGGCGGCKNPSQILCGNVCQDKKTPAQSCVAGATTDYCAGTCGCPAGQTPSGKFSDRRCVSFADRFVEIVSYGLARYGQSASPAENGRYDYSATGKEPLMSEVYLKSDVTETLNWASDSLPPVIQSFITHNGNNSYILCSESVLCPAGITCSDGGLCYTEGDIGTIGKNCSSASQCNWGLICDASGTCADPYGGSVSCKTDADCAGGKKCGADHFCHDPGHGAGDVCSENSDCAEGLYCGNLTEVPGGFTGSCVTLDSLTGVRFRGFSAADAFNSPLTAPGGGYAAANKKCDAGFSGSHVCTVEELLYLMSHNPGSLPTNFSGWINGGPPGFPAYANDCRAWSAKPQPPFANTALGPLYDPANAFGRFWNFFTRSSALKPCGETGLPFVCCQ